MKDPGIIQQAPETAKHIAQATSIADRASGVLLGLAAGNSLGGPTEGARHDYIAKQYPQGITEIDPSRANEPMDDDLAQAVELGAALLEAGDLAENFAKRMITWYRTNGRGIGMTTRAAIHELENGTPVPEAARVVYERRAIAPNGGVMRCAPIAIAHRQNPELLVRDSAITCAVTHYAPTCQWSCIIINSTIATLLNGNNPDLAATYQAAIADGCPDLVATAHKDGIPTDVLDAIANGTSIPQNADWLRKDQKLIGHTLLALQCGLWAAATPLNFEDALIEMVSTGGDADTNGAVAGAVLGARYGASAIPQRWLDCIPERERIKDLAINLLEQTIPPNSPETGDQSTENQQTNMITRFIRRRLPNGEHSPRQPQE